MKHHGGKTFISPPTLFKGSKALYFPNLQGITLGNSSSNDTTSVLRGRISIVSLFSSVWGEQQTQTFLSKANNPALTSLLNTQTPSIMNGEIQTVRINVEENALRYYLLRLFTGRLRSLIPAKDWSRYFVVRKGLTDQLRNELGAVNGKVGYVYLVDEECKIRWAGCGPAMEEERLSMVKGLRKLVNDAIVRKGSSQGQGQGQVQEVPLKTAAQGL